MISLTTVFFLHLVDDSGDAAKGETAGKKNYITEIQDYDNLSIRSRAKTIT